jgi:hypothetical protein
VALVVLTEWPDRYDDRLAALPGDPPNWVSATDRALTRWGPNGPEPAQVHADPRRGPLIVLPNGSLGWGPTVGDDGPGPTDLLRAALAEPTDPVGGSDRWRAYELVLGAVDGTGSQALVAIRTRPQRTIGSGTRSDHGLVLIDRASLTARMLAEDRDTPTALSWGVGPLLVGRPGMVAQWDRPGSECVVHTWGTPAAPRCLAAGAELITAGLADGTVAVWSRTGGPKQATPRQYHSGPVLAVAWGPGDRPLATGGADGTLRVHTEPHAAPTVIDLRAAVVALAWVGTEHLIAKAGSGHGRLLLLRLD